MNFSTAREILVEYVEKKLKELKEVTEEGGKEGGEEGEEEEEDVVMGGVEEEKGGRRTRGKEKREREKEREREREALESYRKKLRGGVQGKKVPRFG